MSLGSMLYVGQVRYVAPSMQQAEWIALKGFDDDQPVYVHRAQMFDFLPVLARQITHDPPRNENGVLFWRLPCTRDTLIGVIKSMNCNGMCVHGKASQEDVLCELTRLGAVVRYKYDEDTTKYKKQKGGDVNCEHSWTPVQVNPTLQTLRGSLHQLATKDIHLKQTCSQLCYAVSKWPRLVMPTLHDHGYARSSFSCSMTRVWVQFINKPASMISRECKRSTTTPSQFLASWDEQRWMRDIFLTLMKIRIDAIDHLREIGTIGATLERSNETAIFDRVARTIDAHPCGSFWPVVYDSGRRARDDNKMLRIAYVPSATQSDLITDLCQLRQALADNDSIFSKDDAARYVNLVRRECCHSVSPSRLFGADCLGPDGSSPERHALEDAFKQQGMRILCWSDSIGVSTHSTDDTVLGQRSPMNSQPTPAMFPPHWNTGHTQASTPTPAVLIAFGE